MQPAPRILTTACGHCRLWRATGILRGGKPPHHAQTIAALASRSVHLWTTAPASRRRPTGDSPRGAASNASL